MASIFSTKNMSQSASTLFSAYASFAASMMMIRSMANEIIPHEFRSYIISVFHYLFTPLSPTLTLVIDEFTGIARYQVYDAASTYLRTKISPSMDRLRISKTPREKQIAVAIEKGESVTDVYDGVKLRWQYVCVEPQNNHSSESKHFELSFNKKFKYNVMNSYLPYVLERADQIKEEEKVVKLYNRENLYEDDGGGIWGSINLEHPATFDTIAMDPVLKKMIMEDLERFVRRREFYKKVGKAWKRGYLLFGPPGTGKSSLIAGMANYLKFDIYDLELTSIYSNSDLRRILLSTTNRSILVIEDIDCSVEIHDRQDMNHGYRESDPKLTLSGVLNFIDGLWSSCGDERIIIFTTNHKDKLDPALLRPGRMDMHINMSYCTTPGFHILASNYLGIEPKTHRLSRDIEGLIETTSVTPAEIAEEPMKSEDVDVALEGLLKFLERKNSEAYEFKTEENWKVEEHEDKRQKTDDDEMNIATTARKKKLRAARRGKKKKKSRY